MSRGTNKTLRTWERVATRAGWEIEKPKSGHWKWHSPSGRYVVTPSSPGEGRALLNIRAELRRHGLVVS